MVYIGFDNEDEIKLYIYNETSKETKEKWKNIIINNEKTVYKISNLGKIKNIKEKRLLVIKIEKKDITLLYCIIIIFGINFHYIDW